MLELSNWFHRYQIVRRIIIFWAMGMSTYIYWKVFELYDKDLDPLMVAALLAPASTLMGFVIKKYAENKYQDGK